MTCYSRDETRKDSDLPFFLCCFLFPFLPSSFNFPLSLHLRSVVVETILNLTTSTMSRFSFALTAVLSCLLLWSGEAFQRPHFARSSVVNNSLTQLHVFGFLNDGKKALVKSLAGEYDQAAIQARMQGLIDENSVFMFSFTTYVRKKRILCFHALSFLKRSFPLFIHNIILQLTLLYQGQRGLGWHGCQVHCSRT